MTLAIFAAALAVVAADPAAALAGAAPPYTREVVTYKDLKAADAQINGRPAKAGRAHGETASAETHATAPDLVRPDVAAPPAPPPTPPLRTRAAASRVSRLTPPTRPPPARQPLKRTPPRLRPAFALGATPDVRP